MDKHLAWGIAVRSDDAGDAMDVDVDSTTLEVEHLGGHREVRRMP